MTQRKRNTSSHSAEARENIVSAIVALRLQTP